MQQYIKTEEHQMIKDLVRKFAEKELEPIASELDKNSTFPIGIFKKLADLELLGIPISDKYGGGNGDLTSVCILIEELARVSPGLAMSIQVHLAMVEYGTIEKFANDDQKRRFLPRLCSGEAIGAFALTESKAGSDAAGIQTYAKYSDGVFIINGSKTFITNPAANMDCILIVTAQTSEKPDGKKEFSNFIVEKSQPGVFVGNKFDKLGMCASPTSEVFFENVIVEESNLLGIKGKGLKQALTILDVDRILASCLAIGILDRVLEESVKYVHHRYQFNKPLKDFQSIQFKIADMDSDLRIARSMLNTCLELEKSNSEELLISQAASLKLFSTTAATKHTLEAIQIFGGYGYMKEYPVERFMRDAKFLEIGGGTNEILKLTIARKAFENSKVVVR